MTKQRKRPHMGVTMNPDVKRKLQYIAKNTIYQPSLSRLVERLMIDHIAWWEEQNGPITEADLASLDED